MKKKQQNSTTKTKTTNNDSNDCNNASHQTRCLGIVSNKLLEGLYWLYIGRRSGLYCGFINIQYIRSVWRTSNPSIDQQRKYVNQMKLNENFLTYETGFVLSLVVLENSVLPMG